MALLIEGMEMPKDGVYWCEIGVADDIAMITIHGEDRKSFPLVPVHEPHGRLIEADKLKETLDYYISEAGWSDEINKTLSWVKDEFIDSEPTIIPATEAEEGE